MGHIDANIEVLIGFGNDVGSGFHTIIKQTFLETGLGRFCMQGLTLPSSLNITEGMNATIQVITNGDPDGGLYNCADITFTTGAAPASGVCTNGTGVTASSTTIATNANVTEAGAASTTSATKKGGAVGVKVGMGGLVAAGVIAFAMAI
jgi:hypothetical protein